MRTHDRAEILARVFLTVAVLALTALVIWFLLLPEADYELLPSQTESILTSENIPPNGISQSIESAGGLRGIRVRWATHKTIPKSSIIAELILDDDGSVAGRVEIPASDIVDNRETDILFPDTYGAGSYRFRLSSPDESSDTVAVWKSANNTYVGGSAYNSRNEADSGDWDFNLLIAYPASMLARHRILKTAGIVLTGLVCGVLLTWIYGAASLRKVRRIRSLIRWGKAHSGALLILLLILVPTIAYLDFLTGDRLYVFTMLDRGADSVGQTYPNLLNTAARLRNGIWGEYFNFRQGLGDAQPAFFPTLTSWVALGGESRIGWLLGVSQWIKVVLSGIFAWLFVRERGGGKTARFAVAMGYCFNCMLIMRGAWESYPNISLLVILWLYAYERRLNGRGVLLYFFSTLFMFINFGLYDCVLFFVLISVYILIRRIVREKTRKEIFLSFMRDFGWFALFALAGMLDTVRYMLIRTLSSSRLKEGVEGYAELVGEGFFSKDSIWITGLMKTVGQSINGIVNHRGPLNLLEGPAFYTGIIALITAPASILLMRGRKKWVSLLFAFAALCYIAIVPLRLVANGFAKETFKLSSFWIVILLMLLCVEFFLALEKGRPKRLPVIIAAVITAGICVFTLVCGKDSGYVASENEWNVSMALIGLYLVLILLRLSRRRIPVVRFLLVCCVAAESVLVPYEMIHDRHMEDRLENSQQVRAATRAAVASLPDDGWYRVEKDYYNVFLTDSMAEGYNGSASYLGGVEINQSVQNLYRTYSLPRRGNHYLYGSGGNVRFESATATKYLLSVNDMAFRYGYHLLGTQSGIKIYENEYALPLAWFSPDQTSPDDLKGQYDLPGSSTAYQMANKNVYLFGVLPKGSMLIVEAGFSPDANTRGTLYMQDRSNQISAVYFYTTSQTVIEISNDQVFSVWLDSSSAKRLTDISFFVADQDTYYRAYREHALQAQENAADLQAVGENEFTGTIRAPEDGYIITAIPYTEKWRIALDGQTTDAAAVNGGFLGASVPAGEHRVEIRYQGDSWFAGNKYKIIGTGAFLFAAFMIKSNKKRTRRDCNHEKES